MWQLLPPGPCWTRTATAYEGFDLVFTRKINPGSGVGSSAASCVAAVVGVNHLLGTPFETAALIPYAMEGEKIASGAIHADNIAPALLGGFTLIRGYDPLDIKHIPYPSDLWCAVVHPQLEIKTMESRKLIPSEVSMETALQQCGNLAGLVAGLATGDYGLISRSVTDVLCRTLPHPATTRFCNFASQPWKQDRWEPDFPVPGPPYSASAGERRWPQL